MISPVSAVSRSVQVNPVHHSYVAAGVDKVPRIDETKPVTPRSRVGIYSYFAAREREIARGSLPSTDTPKDELRRAYSYFESAKSASMGEGSKDVAPPEQAVPTIPNWGQTSCRSTYARFALIFPAFVASMPRFYASRVI